MWPFKQRMPVEDLIATFVRTIPFLITNTHKQKSNGFPPLDDADIANASAAMYLFFLSGELPYRKTSNIGKMTRALRSMWEMIYLAGGNEVGARAWFTSINAQLAIAEPPLNRVHLAFRTLREVYNMEPTEPFAYDFLPIVISNAVKTTRKLDIC